MSCSQAIEEAALPQMVGPVRESENEQAVSDLKATRNDRKKKSKKQEKETTTLLRVPPGKRLVLEMRWAGGSVCACDEAGERWGCERRVSERY